MHLIGAPGGDALQRVADLLGTGKVRAIIDRVFPMLEVEDAIAYQKKGRCTGKVVIEVDQSK